MQITKRHWIAAGVGVAIAVGAGAGVWYWKASLVPAFPINPADHIASWSFTGPYSGNAALLKQATDDIAHLTALMGKGEYDDYDLHLGIGNDDALIGDGAGAYGEYNRAVKIHPAKGLAYVNLGHLFDLLGAEETAADAYAKAVAVEPAVLEYHVERLTFLTTKFPNDTARIQAALADAAKQFGDVAEVLSIEAQWLTKEGRYADAIAAWERVKLISPGRDMTAVNAAIAHLKTLQ